MANMIKMSVTKTDGTIDELEMSPEQYVDLMTAVYKPQVQTLPQALAPVPKRPSQDEILQKMQHEDALKQVYAQCDGWAGNYNQPNLMNTFGPRIMNSMIPSGYMDPVQEMEHKKKMLLTGIGAGVAGLVLGGLAVGFICAMKANSPD